MPEFDVEAFVAQLERLGVKLTAVTLADGKLRVNRWRMMQAAEHAEQIRDLWASQIGDDQARMDVRAAHLVAVQRGVPAPANRAAPVRPAAGPPKVQLKPTG